MDENKRTWKDYFLSSGLPLEQSVTQILEKLEVYDITEFQYERKNQDGVKTLFSIDIYGSQYFHDNSRQTLVLDILCECKYRHDSVKWIFNPNIRHLEYITQREYFLNLDEMVDVKVIDKDRYLRFTPKMLLCSKGIEIQEKDTNNKAIEQALSQLRYGVVNLLLESLLDQLYPFMGMQPAIHVTLPIVVTTAELWRINNGVTIKEIREAEKIDQVGKKLEALVIYDSPDNLFKRYSKELVESRVTPKQSQMIEARLKNNLKINYANYMYNKFCENPSFFFVINYEYFYKTMKKILTFFNDTTILKKREKPKSAEQLMQELKEKADKRSVVNDNQKTD